MDDYALVLNAGSSSLKFCVFERPFGERWHLEARGQIEGIGTAPRLSAKDENGQSLANQDVAVRDAITHLPDGHASVACPLTRRWGRTPAAR